MATKKISALTSIGTIDPTADVIPIVDTSLATTNKVTPNALFGITGSVVGTSDTQNVTNKTLDNTNTLTVKDTNFTLQDDGDVTKQVKFQLSGITTGNIRTLTVPNASVTLASLTGTEIFTNKTLTSPIITGGSIDNTTITVDAISGHTTSTIVTVGGVQLNNGVIGTSGAVVTASIAAGAVVPNSLFASTGTGWAFSTWAPSWTNLTVGNGTVVAKWIQHGKSASGYVAFTMGTTSAISGDVQLTLPFTASISYLTDHAVGTARLVDAGVNGYPAIVYLTSTTKLRLSIPNVAATYPVDAVITSAIPFTWGTGDFFTLSFADIEVA